MTLDFICPLLVVAGLFVGNSILLTVPKGNTDALACFTVSQQIAAPISFPQSYRRDNALLKFTGLSKALRALNTACKRVPPNVPGDVRVSSAASASETNHHCTNMEMFALPCVYFYTGRGKQLAGGKEYYSILLFESMLLRHKPVAAEC